MHPLRQSIMRLLLGVGFLLAAVAFGIFGTQSARAEALRIEQLPHLDAAESKNGVFVCSIAPKAAQDAVPGGAAVVQIEAGSEVLIEGRISQLNQPHYRDFIAYVREEYRGTSDNGVALWVEDQRVTPALLIDLAGGSVRLANNDYRLDSPHQRWQTSDKLFAPNAGIAGTKRYTGLIGDLPVTAIGVLVYGPGGAELRTSFIFGGTRAEYIASQFGAAAYLPWLGLCAAVIGITLIANSIRRIGVRTAAGSPKRGARQMVMGATQQP